ncbi:MAG: dTDP-4-dehydrorhamnose 3,5-epimerase [Thiotrichales bacterium]
MDTEIDAVKIVEPAVYGDDRGYFFESWQKYKFAELGIDETFLQDNQSYSCRGTLRGIHLQIAHPQGKLVSVPFGEVFDIAVDLRPDSPTVGKWVGAHLSQDNHRMLWIPPGFGHAFLVLSEHAVFSYKCTDIYYGDDQYTLAWDDPSVGVEWPELPEGATKLLSEKDSVGMTLEETLTEIKAQS